MPNKFKIKRGSVTPTNSANIDNYELVYNYTDNELWTKHNGSVVQITSNTSGTVTNVVTENGISGGPITSTGTIGLNFSTLTDMTGDISGTTEFILQNGTVESRKAASEIKLTAFDATGFSIAGAVDTSGTPIAQEYARFTDANTIEGRSAAGVRTDLGLVVGTNVQAQDTLLQDIADFSTSNAGNDGKVVTYQDSDGTLVLSTPSAGTITSVTGMTNNNVLTASGSTTISGEGNLTFDGTNLDLPDSKKIRLGTFQDLELFHDSAHTWIQNKTGHFLIRNQSHGSKLQFGTEDSSGTLAYVLNITGDNHRVGIGATSPGYKLDVAGDINLTGNLRKGGLAMMSIDGSYTTILKPDSNVGIYLGQSDANNYYDNTGHIFRTANGSANLGKWNSTGLGIGTTSPSTKLHVAGTGTFTGHVDFDSTITVDSILYASQIDLTSELNFTGNGDKIIDVQTLENSNSFRIRNHNPLGNVFHDALKLVGNGGAHLYYNNSKKLETTNTGATVTGNIAVSGTVDGRDIASDGSKLDGIESGATADQTITLTGDVTGSGTGSFATTIVDDSHNHSWLNSNTNDPGDSRFQYWQAANNTTINPTSDWYTAIRMGHGDPVTYYGNTLAIKMTGSGSGTIYTRNLSNGTQGSWFKHWHDGNDGAGSGLDADLLDGIDSGAFLRSNTSDTIGAQLTMGTQTALVASNYGHGVFGVYSASKYQHVWSMGTAYKGPVDGTSTGNIGNLYGLAWSYNPDYNAVGNNAQSKVGLGHQLLLANNGTTRTALGTGIWTQGHVTLTNNKNFQVEDAQGNIANLIKLDTGNAIRLGDATHVDQIAISTSSTTNAMIFQTNGSIALNGNVTMSSPATINYGLVVNEGGHNNDTRIEGDTDQHLIFADAGTDRVGIGRSAPTYKLDVNGDVRLTNSGDQQIRFERSGANAFSLEIDSSRAYWYNRTTSTASVAITNAGNFGIGTVSPTKKLHVEGSTRLNGDTIVGPNNNNSKAFIRANNGYSSASTPDYTWYYNDQCGIFHPAGNVIGFSAGGEKARITSQGITVTNGSLASPSYSFTSDPNTGIFLSGADDMAFVAGGYERFAANGNGLDLSSGSVNKIVMPAVQSRDKYRVWNSSYYCIGMDADYTFGALTGYAMTFQMNDEDGRGWWWGHHNHSKNSNTTTTGAMSLDTNGKLALAHSMRIGYGESDTTAPGATASLEVKGSGTGLAGYFENTSSNGTVMQLKTTGDNKSLYFQTDHIYASGEIYLGHGDQYTRYRGASHTWQLTSSNTTNMTLNSNQLLFAQPVRIQFANDQRIFDDGGGGLKVGSQYNQLTLFGGTNTGEMRFLAGGRNGTEKVRFDASGNGHFVQDVVAYSSTPSDIRLKKNFTKIDNGLDVISKLDGQTFNWKKDDGRLVAGFKAQEVEKVLPHLVNEKKLPLHSDDDKDYKVLRYEELIPYLVEAIKEQQVQIDELKTKLGE